MGNHFRRRAWEGATSLGLPNGERLPLPESNFGERCGPAELGDGVNQFTHQGVRVHGVGERVEIGLHTRSDGMLAVAEAEGAGLIPSMMIRIRARPGRCTHRAGGPGASAVAMSRRWLIVSICVNIMLGLGRLWPSGRGWR